MTAPSPPSERSRIGAQWIADSQPDSLQLQVCGDCQTVQYPPREVCRKCLGNALQTQTVPNTGTMLAKSELTASLNAWFRERLPWAIASIHLDAGPTAICHLKSDSLTVGDPVIVSLEAAQSGSVTLVAKQRKSA